MRASTTTSLLLASWTLTDAFTMPSKHLATKSISSQSQHFTKLFAENEVKLADEPRTISAKARQNNTIEFKSSDPIKDEPSTAAKTNTVNERLIAELQAAANAEKGPKTKVGEKFKGAFSYSDKSDAERLASLEAAKDLNGVNPTVTIIASFFAFAMAFGLWSLTEYLAALFLSHPPPADAPYAFIRAASVFRNAVMGLISLASGFAGVSGLGVFLLGVRVAYGVMIGELDPTPIKKASDDVEVPNVWDLMMNKKPNRKSRK
jgi:hypothetical protein